MMANKNSVKNPLSILSFYYWVLEIVIQLMILTVSSGPSELTAVNLRTKPVDYLQMPRGSPFKIAIFADLHFGEDAWTDWGPQQDVNSIRVMSNVLDREHPGKETSVSGFLFILVLHFINYS